MCKRLNYLMTVIVVSVALINTANAELAGWWKFDETSGITASDSTGNGYDGTLMGNPQWGDGWVDGGLELDGDEDYVDLDIGLLMPTLEECTLAIWVNWSGQGSAWQRIIDIGTGTANYIYITPIASAFSDSLHVAITAGLGWDEFSSSKGTLSTGWHHIAVTSSVSFANMAMYLDGELVGSMEEVQNFVSDLGETTQNWLGRSQYEADPYFNGSLDDFRIYNNVLSELDLHAIAVADYRKAWKPSPADGEVELVLDSTLTWNPGIINDQTFELYNEHHLYIGTDFNDVNSATEPTAVLTDVSEYTTPLEYNTTYYWRVDEASSLDPNGPVRGNVWNFTTRDFIVVEDFEDYNDFEPDTIYLTWIDGWEDPANGSTSGYANPVFGAGQHFMETTIFHGGLQSMPLLYDNSVGLSESTKTLTDVRDWTQDDVIALTVFYYGDPGNSLETMYVALNGDAVVSNDDPRAVLANEWTRWDILLQEFADQGVNLSDVDRISLGFGNKAAPVAGGTGTVLFDDIRLYRSIPADVEPEPESVDPGTANLMAYYAFENNVQDTSGNGQDGEVFGNPSYVSGPTDYGMALEFDGDGDYVMIPIGSTIASASDITVGCWVNFSNMGGDWQRIWDFGNGEESYMFVTPRIGSDGSLRFAITTDSGEGESNITAPSTLPTGWQHVAAMIDSSDMTMYLYQNGRVVAEGTTTVLPSDLGNTTENYIGLSQYAADGLFNGIVDELRIYDRTLSELELRYLAGK